MKFLYFDEVDSTQDVVKELAQAKVTEPVWVRAGNQTKGRGRRGREWVPKKGNLYASGLYPWAADPGLKPLSSFVVALALAQTLEHYIDADLIRLKWPNDVLVGGAKIAGILLEAGEGWLIIGVGLNLLGHPEDAPYPVTHLLKHIPEARLNTPEPIFAGPEPVLAQLAHFVTDGLNTLQSGGFTSIRKDWLTRAARLGETITVNLDNETISGRFETLGENGALRLRLANGTLRDIVAGDVLL